MPSPSAAGRAEWRCRPPGRESQLGACLASRRQPPSQIQTAHPHHVPSAAPEPCRVLSGPSFLLSGYHTIFPPARARLGFDPVIWEQSCEEAGNGPLEHVGNYLEIRDDYHSGPFCSLKEN